LIKLDYLNN